MKKFVYFLMFCLAFNLCFSFSFDVNKLKDVSKIIAGKVNKTKWEESLKIARKIYYWTKNNIQYDYEKDKKILEGKNFSIKSPYQTFLTRKGNSYEIALLDLVLLYNTGLFSNSVDICQHTQAKTLINRINYFDNLFYPYFTSDKKFIDCISGPKRKVDEIILDILNISNNQIVKIPMFVPKYRYLDNFVDRIIECGDKIYGSSDKWLKIRNKIIKLKKNIPFNIKRNIYFGTIVFNNTKKIKAFVAFDTYLKPLCGVFECGNSRVLMILDPEFGIFTLSEYVDFLNKKYNNKAKYIFLYNIGTFSGKFILQYIGSIHKRVLWPFIIDYSKGMDNFAKAYNMIYRGLKTDYIPDGYNSPYPIYNKIKEMFKKYYPAPYNEINYSG